MAGESLVFPFMIILQCVEIFTWEQHLLISMGIPGQEQAAAREPGTARTPGTAVLPLPCGCTRVHSLHNSCNLVSRAIRLPLPCSERMHSHQHHDRLLLQVLHGLWALRRSESALQGNHQMSCYSFLPWLINTTSLAGV